MLRGIQAFGTVGSTRMGFTTRQDSNSRRPTAVEGRSVLGGNTPKDHGAATGTSTRNLLCSSRWRWSDWIDVEETSIEQRSVERFQKMECWTWWFAPQQQQQQRRARLASPRRNTSRVDKAALLRGSFRWANRRLPGLDALSLARYLASPLMQRPLKHA